MGKEYSINKEAERIIGKRPEFYGIIIDEPCELGYHCPICEYELVVNGNFDGRLHWSEYESFIWCSVCNLDIPSCLCIPNLKSLKGIKRKKYEFNGLKDAIKIFLDSAEGFKNYFDYYCCGCGKLQPVMFEPLDNRDIDILCKECHLIIATVKKSMNKKVE